LHFFTFSIPTQPTQKKLPFMMFTNSNIKINKQIKLITIAIIIITQQNIFTKKEAIVK